MPGKDDDDDVADDDGIPPSRHLTTADALVLMTGERGLRQLLQGHGAGGQAAGRAFCFQSVHRLGVQHQVPDSSTV
jgi:hypothetical protein